MEQGRGGQGRTGQGRAGLSINMAKLLLFSMTILCDLRVTVCVCSEGSALFHTIQAYNISNVKHLR